MRHAWTGALTTLALSLTGPMVLLLAWEVLSRTGALNIRFFPPPTIVLSHAAAMLASWELQHHVAVSTGRITAGFILGAVPAVLLGLGMGMSRVLRLLLMPVAAAIYPVPKIAILPLVLVVLGLGELSKVVLVAISVFFLVLLNTVTGVLSVERTYFDAARNMGASRWQVLATVAFPGALPMVFSGFKLAIGFALVVIVGTEFLAARSGVGELIWRSYQIFDIESMYVGLITTAVMGWLFILAFDLLERVVVRWQPAGR